MSQKTKIVQIFLTNGIILLALVSLSGCTTNQNENQNTNKNVNALLGTWVGSIQIPMFSGDNNVTVSQIAFTSDRTEMVLTSGNRTFTMNYTYSVNGDSLVLIPMMNNRDGFGDRPPFNGTFPDSGTRPPGNWTRPPNGTQPPGNGTWPSNGTRPAGNNQPSMTISFIYALEEEARVLFLNNVKFIKV